MITTARVHVQDHCFLIGDAGTADLPFDVLDWSSGIAGTMPTAMLVDAGIHSGTVTVAITVAAERPSLEASPEWATTDEWDDIAEVSIHLPDEDIALGQLQYPPAAGGLELPLLNSAGPGHYRFRMHVTGRDAEFEQAVEHSNVRFHVVAWPAPPSAPLVIKATSMCGYGLRLAQLGHRPD
ncbi:hypothetical protein [Actinoplanes sp. DH11]|uniref:hypothetical protein n=1 Tax=Actinoplanes sp. DH11 TaxID=2857011 RepID=UPI001E4A310A|nr:hypothetical protein [Actinoplanes sp. DH11]